MSQEKYIGMDVHAATISAAVKNVEGKLLMECVLETKAATILEFIQGLRGTLVLTFEEGTLAAWLHDLLKPHVSRLVVCDPRKNALLRDGNQNDRADARNLAELRPRASDRTMVDLESPFASRSRKTSTAPLTHRTLIRMGTSQTSPAKPNSSGLDLEKQNLDSG